MAYNSNGGDETISILNVSIEPAVTSIGDLKKNIKTLKEELENLTIGETEYQEKLAELKVNQNALKDAMYATNTSMEDLAKSANGTAQTYNGLVAKMADLKTQLRSTDTSTKQGKKTFKELAESINDINDELKKMDEQQGIFSRSVGNYKTAFKGLADYADSLDKAFKASTASAGGLKNGCDAISKSPFVGTISILVMAVSNMAGGLKENETAMSAIKKLMDSLKPVMDFFAGLMQKMAEVLSDIIVNVAQFITTNGLFDKILKGVMGVGNAIKEVIIMPFKMVIDAIKIFKEKGVKGLGEVADAIKKDWKTGTAFKTNFETGEAMTEAIAKGAKSKAKEEMQGVAKEYADILKDEFDESLPDDSEAYKMFSKEIEERRKAQEKSNKERIASEKAMHDEIAKMNEEELKKEQEKAKKEEELHKQRLDTMNAVASATSSILGSIADMYEADSKSSEKNAKKIKNIRIASATIDTISGAIGAYMQSVETIPPPMGIVTGALQASAVLASGMAQIASIKKTNVSTSSASSAVVSAPTLSTNVAQVRNLTSASEEERLNRMASEQRVYILSSDIEASNNRTKVQIAETSF